MTDGPTAASTIHERAVGHDFRLAAGGFWQVHPAAADTLVRAALDAVAVQSGETALDLYAGVGLFAVALGDAVGPRGRVTAVEQDRTSVEHARLNVAATAASVSVEAGRVDRVLLRLRGQRRLQAEVVVLDPPRAGAGRRVVELIGATRARSIAYVACDPAALARDVRLFGAQGYWLTGLRAFDLFPMSHHVECVAALAKTS